MKRMIRSIRRQRKRALVASAIVLAATSVLVATPDGLAVAVAASPAEHVEAGRFRAIFGLATDETSIQGARRHSHPESVARFGTALTAAEFADMTARVQRQHAAGPLNDLVERHTDELGPLWIDQRDGGRHVQALLPRTPPALKEAIAAAAPVGANLRFTEVRYSVAELKAAAKGLVDQQVEMGEATTHSDNAVKVLRAAGFDIVSVGPALDATARVRVYLRSLPADRRPALDRLWDQLAARARVPARDIVVFDSIGAFEHDETRQSSPGTMKGGLAIGVNTAAECTSNMTAIGGSIMQMTAGHCWASHTAPTRVTHAWKTVGNALPTQWVNGSNADVRGIQLARGGYASPYMMAAIQCDTCVRHDVAQAPVRDIDLRPGQMVCMGGMSTNVVRCGTITALWFSTPGPNGGTLREQVWADYISQGGDSGAVVGIDAVVYGVHSGQFHDPAVRAFSTIENALERLGGATLLTANPPSTPVSWGLVKSRWSNRCMDVQWNSTTNGAAIWQWGCNGNQAQQFMLVPTGPPATLPPGGVPAGTIWYELKWVPRPGKCADLDVAAGGFNNGAKIQTWDCNGLPQQKWYLTWVGTNTEGFFTIRSGKSNKCVDLDISAGGNADGTKIGQWDCNGQTNQHWSVG